MADEYSHCGYLTTPIREIGRVVDTCIEALAKKKFDTIAFRGMSGALVAPIVAREMDKKIILVRKTTEDFTHSKHMVEGHLAVKKYIVLDDMISSGDTVREILEKVTGFAPQSELAGGCIYNSSNVWVPPGELKERVEYNDD